MINKLQFDELEQTFEMSFTEEIPIKEDWDNGYIEGYKDGEEVGYGDGYTAGEADGYIDGIEVGKEEGYKDGYNSGHTEGFHEGYEKGNEQGYGDGYDIGKEEGIIVGKKEGYEQGYDEGQSSMIDESKIIPKTTAATNPVVVQDVSELPHDLNIQLYSGTIEDFSGIEVVQTGKNILPFPYYDGDITRAGLTYTQNEDGTLTINGTAIEDTFYTFHHKSQKKMKLSGSYTLSGITDGSSSTYYLQLYIDDANKGTVNSGSLTTSTEGNVSVRIALFIKKGVTFDNYVVKPQFEVGTSATEYEPYKEHKAIANSSGAVEGLKSISPKMSIYSNADVDIELTYNKSWGMDYENKAFWDTVTQNNTRIDYQYAFRYWRCEYIRPPYKIIPTKRLLDIFDNNPNLLAVEKEYFDFSKVVNVSDTSSTDGNYGVFSRCPKLKLVEDVGMQAGYLYETYYGCSSLETIEMVRVRKTTLIRMAFNGCNSLKNITFSDDSQIGVSIDFKACPLSKASITNIIEHLCADTDITGQTLTLKKSAVNEAFGIDVDDETTYPVGSEYYELRYSKPNWTIAYA